MPPNTMPAHSRSAVGRFFRNPETGDLAVVQVPNLPLAIFLVATIARLVFHPTGTVGTTVSVVATAAIVWWAVEEIIRGDSPFRRLLGGIVLLGAVLGLMLG
ncbi:MAG: conserved rane protein of unknown function [Acidimicrobiales bacterium]|nr:conserved rane protein of unknown function [Acidimicrobiales bacterium]